MTNTFNFLSFFPVKSNAEGFGEMSRWIGAIHRNQSQYYRCAWSFFQEALQNDWRSFKQLFRYVKAAWWNKIFKCFLFIKAQCSEIKKKPKDIMETSMKADPVAFNTILLNNLKTLHMSAEAYSVSYGRKREDCISKTHM